MYHHGHDLNGLLSKSCWPPLQYIEHFANTFLCCCDWTFVVFLLLYYCTTHHLSYPFVFDVLPPLNCFCSLLSPFFASRKTVILMIPVVLWH